ncbi:conserved hypothetical protein [Vibrio nigripulchritudo SOn1]|uniref:Uncharacterized protein n=1 Tax=Vibrio nigripulchritudo SOn1 TaxID=1238450 RepID=A0AAV2VPV5_9VIBR|nr:hypothetical protein [Vibrio nigripulchritudo]CCO46697.1 conserved hypothetical protein [Vibrio nigripulchritudo SOn1]
MPEYLDFSGVGFALLSGVVIKVVLLVFALVVMTLMRKFIFGSDGVKNDWIAEAKSKGDYRSVAIYQCVMFASTCFLLGSVLS